ncbi:YidC/Oxa1 family membrane protein insertase [Kineococcus sp. SYSU DK002]|uniref:YidC/Oxa1 family membrane protein insertase n=1 Tax=Kineococcus sp. SYSU DK002 TaxID=3383123 RepID=UPI003D7EA355
MPETLHVWLKPLEDAVAWFLVHLHDAGWSWPLAIVTLVLAARLLLLPLFVVQHRSTLAAAALRPRIAELQDRYRGRTDPASRQRRQRELLDLHRDAGVNPFAALWPGLLQAPVFLALTLALESRPFPGAHLAGVPLSSVLTRDPSAVGVALLVLTAAFQCATSLASVQRPPTAVLVAVPVVVALTTAHFPVGVLLYWAVSAGWSAGQQLVARAVSARRVPPAAPRRR